MEEGNKKARYLRLMLREIIDNRLTGRHFPEQLRGARVVTNKGIEMTLPFRDLKTKSGNDKVPRIKILLIIAAIHALRVISFSTCCSSVPE